MQLGAARLPDEPRAEPRHRPAARRRPRRAGASRTRPPTSTARTTAAAARPSRTSTSTTTRNMRCACSRSRSRRATASRSAVSASASPAPTRTRSATRTQPLLPSFRTPGQSTFFRFRAFGTTATAAGTIADGERTRIAPQLYYYVGSLGLLGEYTEVSQDVSRVVTTGHPRRRPSTLTPGSSPPRTS